MYLKGHKSPVTPVLAVKVKGQGQIYAFFYSTEFLRFFRRQTHERHQKSCFSEQSWRALAISRHRKRPSYFASV